MLEDILKPISRKEIEGKEKFSADQWGNSIEIYSDTIPDLDGVDMAIIGVKEERGCIGNEGCLDGPDSVRRSLYKLYNWEKEMKVVDLGNIVDEKHINDTYASITSVVSELLQHRVIPIIIGGSHDLAFPQYCGYEQIRDNMNWINVDERIDVDEDTRISAHSYLSELFTRENSHLFNYSHIGYQRYLTRSKYIELLDELRFDHYRLGHIRKDLEEVELVMRDADMVTIDLSAIRQAEAPGIANGTPNGFYAEEICQIARYAGLSDRLTSIGFYEMNPKYDVGDQTAQLVAQMIWCFLEGFYDRKHDYPIINESNFIKYKVNLKGNDQELVFLKSKKSDRWWMEISQKEITPYSNLISCSYRDYQLACKDEVPERWIRAYEKLGEE